MHTAQSFLAFVFVLAAGLTQAESWRPLKTDGLQTLEYGEIEIDLAVEFRSKTTFPFTSREDQPDRDELKAPRMRFAFGMSERVELQFNYAYLFIEEDDPNVGEQSGSGDVHFFTKWRFLDQEGWRPAFGFRIGGKIPNADDRKRLGTDKADIFVTLLADYSTDRFSAAVNLGTAFLDNSSRFTRQDDVATWGGAVIYRITDKLDAAAEVNGVGLSRGHNNESNFLGALRYQLGPVRIYGGACAGIGTRSEDYGLIGGLTWMKSF